MEEGYKVGHGHYFIYVFNMSKDIGVCPWGFPTKKIWKTFFGGKNLETNSRLFQPISFTRTYRRLADQEKDGSLQVPTARLVP